jgi:hypothetical protein
MDTVLELLHAELKRRIAESLDAEWKAEVLALAEKEDREYTIVAAWRNELAQTFTRLGDFPARYRKMQGRSALTRPGFDYLHDPDKPCLQEIESRIKNQSAEAGDTFQNWKDSRGRPPDASGKPAGCAILT